MSILQDKPKIVRRIAPQLDPVQLGQDLEQLRDQALASGAAEAAVIKREDIVFDQGIRLRIEKNDRYLSVHWPLQYPRDDLEEAILAYQWAIIFRVNTDDNFPNYAGGPIPDNIHRQVYVKLYEIVAEIESTGFYMGYHLSLGLAAGNCRSVFCADENRCWPMLKGRPCIRPNLGRPSMEAAGLDALAMARKLNWQISENAPCQVLAGIVMII